MNLSRTSHPGRLFRRCLAPLALGLGLSALALAQQPVGEVLASDATVKGSVVLASSGAQVMSGSSVTAGTAAASLRLARGGEVRICPGTSVSVAASPSGRELMMSLSAGAIETHYTLAASADSIVTPDFRIQLPGPGTFHFAFSSDAAGNACVRSLENNTASVIVSELLGDGTYQVRPGQTVFFHGGQVSKSDDVGTPCGCPAPPPVMKAEVPPPPPPPGSVPTAALPQPKPGDVQVMVEAPFVFRAEELPGPAPSPVVAQLRLTSLPRPDVPPPAVAPPPKPAPDAAKQAAPTKPAKKGFLGRVSAFFAGIFH
ncbi:MAG TPA: hypothetical protein VE825_16370 [Terriglobales bacterium]|nr:hypothetical protein [Terriglobales bacterium]